MHCRKVKLKSGTAWECFDDAPRDPVTGKRRQIKRRGKTMSEAKSRVESVLDSLRVDGIDERISATTSFDKVANNWLEIYEAAGKKSGSIRVRTKEIKILNKYFAKMPISDITHYIYQDMLLNLDKDGNNGEPYAENTISGVNTCANMIFKYAKRNKLIKDNPREDAVVPKKPITVEDLESNSIEETYFESDELILFLDAVMKIGLELDREWFYTLAFSGVRSGELLALKKSDLDSEENTIRVSKTMSNPDNNMRKYKLETTKTNKVRIINIEKLIMEMLKKLVHKNDVHKMKYRNQTEDFHDADFVFQRPNGYPFATKNVGDRMKRIMKYVNIGKHLTPHSFRHTHISMLTEAGVDLPTIMERVGHEDPDTTLKVYTHVTEKMKIKSVDSVTEHHADLLKKTMLET